MVPSTSTLGTSAPSNTTQQEIHTEAVANTRRTDIKSTNTIEPGTVYVSTMEGEGFVPETPRFVYVPEENAKRPWRNQNPDPLHLQFFGPRLYYFQHEGDLAERIEEGSVRTLTAEEAEIAAAFDAEQAEARP